jgi:hypothetical protein
MKKITLMTLISVTAVSFLNAQSNFTLEWTSPSNENVWPITNTESNNNVSEVITSTENQYKVYDGATHNLKRTYNRPTDSTTYLDFPPYVIPHLMPMDVNHDGLYELIEVKYSSGNSYMKVLNAANIQTLFTYNYSPETYYPAYDIFDIDGDGYLELIIYDVLNNFWICKVYSTTATIDVKNNSSIVKDFELKQNYPNPFNPSTAIEYSLSGESAVKLLLFNEIGQTVKTLVDQKQRAGEYKINLNGLGLASGVYFYQIIIDGFTEAKKMILVK